MDRLISSTVLHFDEKNFFRDENGRMMGEFKKNYGPNIGLSVCGEFDDKGNSVLLQGKGRSFFLP